LFISFFDVFFSHRLFLAGTETFLYDFKIRGNIINLYRKPFLWSRDPCLWAGHVARVGAGRGVYRVLVGKLEGKRPLGRPRHRREDNIRMDLQEVGCGCEGWIGLAQDRDKWRALVSAVRELSGSIKRGEFLD
jgi:hypothetical protein